MPVVGRETWDSRNVTVSPQDADSVLRYFVTGSYDPEDITAWVVTNVPLIYGVLVLQDVPLTNLGGGCWFVDAKYGPVSRDGAGKPDGTGEALDPQGIESQPPSEPQRPKDTDNLGPEFSFEVSEETVHITQSRNVTDALSSVNGEEPPDCHFAIGLTHDGVEGVDVGYGVLRISETRKFTSITRKYIDFLTELCGKVCDSRGFWGWGQREVKFDGATGEGHNDGSWTITYRFSIRKTRQKVRVSPDIEFPFVRGWDYIDVIYTQTVDTETLLRIPRFAYVHVLYEEADFSKLGIGK